MCHMDRQSICEVISWEPPTRCPGSGGNINTVVQTRNLSIQLLPFNSVYHTWLIVAPLDPVWSSKFNFIYLVIKKWIVWMLENNYDATNIQIMYNKILIDHW